MITTNLNSDDPLGDLFDRVAAMERSGSSRNASVTEGTFRFYGGKLLGLAGAMFEWVGTFGVTGPTTLEGPVSITGATGTLDVAADTTLGGNTTIAGLAQLLSDLIVHGAGRIQVGSSMTLDPSVSSGAVVFSNGAQVFTDASTIQVYKGNGVVQISDTEAKLQLGGSVVRCDSDGVTVTGPAGFSTRVTFGGRVFATNLDTVSGTGAVAGTLVVSGPDREVKIAV